MPQIVELPDGRTAEFPDTMSRDQIRDILRQKFSKSSGPKLGDVMQPPTTQLPIPSLATPQGLTAESPVQPTVEEARNQFYAERKPLIEQFLEPEQWKDIWRERTIGVPTALEITPESIPAGTAIAESPAYQMALKGIPGAGLLGEKARKVPAIIGTSVARTALGLADYMSSPQGLTELVASFTPARLLVFGKWAVDMAQGSGTSAGELSTLIGKVNKTPEDWQHISDLSLATIAQMLGATGTALHVKSGVQDLARRFHGAEGPIPVESRFDLAQQMENEVRARRAAEAGSPFTLGEVPADVVSMGFRTQPPLSEGYVPAFEPSGTPIPMQGAPRAPALQQEFIPSFEPSGMNLGAGEPRLGIPPEVALSDWQTVLAEQARAEAAQAAGSPFLHEPPPEGPISMGFRTVPNLGIKYELFFNPESLTHTTQLPFEPSGLKMAGPEIPPEVSAAQAAQPPAPPIAPGARPTAASAKVRLEGEAAQRMADFEKALAEKVSQEQEAKVHPDKPLTENQLRIIQDSLTKALSENQLKGKGGLVADGPLEAWADQVLGEVGPTPLHGGVPIKGAAAALVKGVALLERGLRDAKWVDEMLKQFGEGIKPMLGQIRKQSEDIFAKKGGESNALQREAEAVLRDVRQPEVTPEGEVRLPVDQNRQEVAAPRQEVNAADIAKMSPEDYAQYSKGRDQLADQRQLADTESADTLKKFADDAAAEVESLRKTLDVSDPRELEKFTAAASKYQFFTEALQQKGEAGRLYSLPHPDAIKAIGRQAWNDAVATQQAALKAGKSAADAIDAALKLIQSKVPSFDEAKIRANLGYTSSQLAGAAQPTQQPAQPPPIPPAGAAGATPPPIPVTHPVTGEPATMITEAAAKAMERKVKLPAESDMQKVREQLDLFNNQIGDALESGGRFLPKELRPNVAKGAPAEPGTVTSKAINQYFVNKLSTLRTDMQALRRKIEAQADPASRKYYDVLQERFENAFRQIQELRRASHESLYFWNKIRAEYQAIARAANAMPEMRRQKPILDQIWKDMREKDWLQAGRHTIDYLRMNLFTLGSWTLDFGTNLVATTTKLPAWAIMDIGSLISGNHPTRMFSALRALADNTRNWNPLGKRFRLPERVEVELGTTAGAEFGGAGREVMVDFSEILKNHPELANKLKEIDRLLSAPVRMKRAIDTFFGRFGATAELYHRAYQDGHARGLLGDELKQHVEEFVRNPDQASMTKAIKTGKELKFNRDLSLWEERYANWIGTKLVLEAFPRWTLQFARWAGEMVGVDPVFYKKLAQRKVTGEDLVNYLTKAATGWGGIIAFNELYYDQIDANSMEYVTEEGDRIRLSGRTPAPELYFVCALLRGDTENAKAALQYLSLPGARFFSGQPGGVISPIFDTLRESMEGNYTAEMTSRELTNTLNNLIPGKSVLGLMRSLQDPTVRVGIGAPIPGVSSLLPQRINPTTGEPLAPMQRIPGLHFDIPTVGGTPFPGARRVLNDVEAALLNHGLGLTRPRRTSIIELPAEDVSSELRTEYEQLVGHNVANFIGSEISMPDFWTLPIDVRREILSQLLSDARAMARVDLADKYGVSAAPTPSIPMNLRRLPTKLRKEFETELKKRGPNPP